MPAKLSKPSPKPADDPVEELAAYIHRAFVLAVYEGKKEPTEDYKSLSDFSKGRYRGMALWMIDNPSPLFRVI